ncbi:acetyltransferase [Conyzicola nivalis]|uniref:Pilus assembly protein n=1 Tax=Conyzicola nivalis TaxID=1477021 RepID=A0A916SPJ5_9MICO|nr:acetyltransferase [Conyzicola nivalis]GGB10118.1 pilus assembly protein [Conyzicola nivalis]
MTDLIVLGASGLAREALAVVRETGSHTPIGVLDDRVGHIDQMFAGLPVLGRIANLDAHARADVLICVGSGVARERIVDWLAQTGVRGIRYATVVDPSVRNPARCRIGAGSIVLANVTITADATVGDHVVVMPGTTITHDDVVDDYATLAAGVSLGGGVTVGRGAYVGMNAAVLPGVTIGVRAVVGMAAAVLQDVPDNETWAGVPAHPLTARPLEMTR